ncbi:MAG TPA: LacI family DNA-binding transcriptional regulator [Fimbriimonas sp.]|nr:LacI family DNA-binding transcriptional regulator [Fimbriimonas sp.]
MSTSKPATLKEIALRAGVNTAAVSVVLNGSRSTSRVSAANREAVLRAAAELNYRPNGLARSLRKRRTGIIGYFSGYQALDPRNAYIAEVMSGLQAACVRLELDLLLYTPHRDLSPEMVVNSVSDGRLDGVIVTARNDHPIVPLLARAHLPVVAIADLLPDIPSVVADSGEGGRLQARHLHEEGHRHVLYLPADFPFASVLERQSEFVNQAGRLGMKVTFGRSIHGYHPELSSVESKNMRMPDEDLDRLRGPDRATCVLCWDDTPAFRVASQLSDLGFGIPKDVAVMGFNGCFSSTEPRWNLSTIRAPFREMASIAVDTLHRAIDRQEVLSVQVLPVELIKGATT